MLVTLAKSGSFARAADTLHVSQPTISYTIAKIEEHLGIPILRTEGRYSRLTDVGLQLVARVDRLLREAAEVEAFLSDLRENWQPKIRLAVDERFPTAMLLPAIRHYSLQHPGTKVALIEGSAAKIEMMMQADEADFGITNQLHAGLIGDVLVDTQSVPLVHPGHPLLALGRPVTDADLHNILHVAFGEVPTNPSGNIWQVSNFSTAVTALIQGIGYGWLPRYQVQWLLDQGRLAVLPMEARNLPAICFYLVHSAFVIPTLLANQFVQLLREALHSASIEKTAFV